MKLQTTEGTGLDLKVFEVSRSISTDFNVLWVQAMKEESKCFLLQKVLTIGIQGTIKFRFKMCSFKKSHQKIS